MTPLKMPLRFRDHVFALLLAATTLWAFWGVSRAGFVGFDDDPYIAENPHLRHGLSADGLRWALTAELLEASPYVDYWSPLTQISRLLDVELFGLDPGPQHLVNLILHVATVVLLFYTMRGLTGRPGPSAFVAAAFALHPLHVEAVAWLTERKDVLSGLFWVSAMIAHAAYARRPTRSRQATLALIVAMGLMAKPMLVMLPVALLLLDYWPLRRWQSVGDLPRLVREKGVLLALSFASTALTIAAHARGGFLVPLDSLPFAWRLGNALRSYVAYLEQAVWPHPLAFYYPHPERSLGVGAVLLSTLVLVAVSVWTWRERRRLPFAVVGWSWYLLTLLPVIGLVQVGGQARADRFTYLPFIGLSFLPAFGLPALVRSERGRRGLAIAAVAIAAGWVALTRAQVETWRDSETLYRHAIAVTGGSPLVHFNLGNLLQHQGRLDEAREQYLAALAKKPGYPDALVNLANLLVSQGQAEAAAEDYRAALQQAPNLVAAHTGLATVLLRLGHPGEALPHAAEAARLAPDMASLQLNLGLVQARLNRAEEAERSYEAALTIEPRSAAARSALGNLLAASGRLGEAERQFAEALHIEPQNADALNNLGRALELQGRRQEAIALYRRALGLDPAHALARRNLQEAESAVRGR